MARIRRVLELSMAHLPPEVRHDLPSHDGVTAYEYVHGWLLWVPDDVDDSATWEPPPDVVLNIQHYARDQHRCDWVMFDTEADPDNDLPVFPDDVVDPEPGDEAVLAVGVEP